MNQPDVSMRAAKPAGDPRALAILIGGVGGGLLLLGISAVIVIWTLSRPLPQTIAANNMAESVETTEQPALEPADSQEVESPGASSTSPPPEAATPAASSAATTTSTPPAAVQPSIEPATSATTPDNPPPASTATSNPPTASTPPSAAPAPSANVITYPRVGALRFTGASRVELAGTESLISKPPFTIEFWCLLEPGHHAYWLLESHDRDRPQGEAPRGMGIYLVNEANNRNLTVTQRTSGVESFSFPAVDGQWHHLAIVAEPDKTRAFFDGQPLVGKWGGAFADASGGLPLNLGDHPVSHGRDDALNGLISGLRISSTARYGQAFTPTSELVIDEDTLLALDFSRQPSDSTIADVGPGKHDGKIHGARWEQLSGEAVAAVGPSGNPATAAVFGSKPSVVSVAPSAQSKSPVPDEAAQDKIRAQLASIFGDAVAKAKKPEERVKLAREFYGVVPSEKDPATRFVLLTAARKMAVAGFDFTLALEMAKVASQQFEVDGFLMRLQTLQEAATAAGSNLAPQKSIAELAADLTEEALASERFDVAEEASKLAYDSAGKSKDAEQRRTTKALRDEVVAEKKLWDAAQAALETLKSNPADAASQLVVGKHYAFGREDWGKALAYLAASGDAALEAAAKAELASADAKGQLTAADRWSDAAASAPADEKLAMQRHALELYDAAAPQLAGLDQIKAEKRRGELKALLDSAEKVVSTTAARATTRRKSRAATLEPGLITRTYRGEPFTRPTQAISLVTSSDEYWTSAIEGVRNVIGNYSPDYLQPMSGGYIALEQAGTVQFELMNCIVILNGAPFAEANRGDVVRIGRKLTKGRHSVLFYRATENIRSGPMFRVKLEDSDKNVLFHAPGELQIELAKPVEGNNGVASTGVLVYRAAK